ncbi:MAG: RidA family protein [Proteobacteria bacterium]|nr:RidA family protein [Pseudomonadota bacterium]
MTITRIKTNKRMSQAVVHGGLVYLAGQVALEAPGADIETQTAAILGQIDRLLDEAASSKEYILSATVWLVSMEDFAAMNSVWDAWIPEGAAPARACVEARLASPDYTVEIAVIAAVE